MRRSELFSHLKTDGHQGLFMSMKTLPARERRRHVLRAQPGQEQPVAVSVKCRKVATDGSGMLDSKCGKSGPSLRGLHELLGLIVCQGSADDSDIMLGGEPDEHIPAHIVLTNGR